MTKNGSFLKKRTVAGIATLALSVSGLMMATAQATDSTVSYGDIDKSATGTVRIHKLESGSLAQKGTEVATSNDGDGVVGVPFKLFPIDADLTTPEGWDKINKVRVHGVPAEVCSPTGDAVFTSFKPESPLTAKSGVQATEVTTGAHGIATASQLPLGAYLVCEQPAPNATNEAGVKVSVVRKAAPFVVTVPHPQTVKATPNDKTGWIYDINVFPKNTVVEAPKKVAQKLKDGLQTADGMQYTITVKVPSLLGDQYFKHFVVIDQLPDALTEAKVVSVNLAPKNGTAANLVATDYQVPNPIQNGFLTVNLTRAGLAKLKAAPNATVTVTITAKVNSLGTNGKIENAGYLVVDTGNGTPPTEEPNVPVVPGGPGNPPRYPDPKDGDPEIKSSPNSASFWGDLKIRKHDASDDTQGLEGAQFQVFAADQQKCMDAVNNHQGKFTSAQDLTAAKQGTALAVGGDAETNKTFTTAKGGLVTIPGLFLGKTEATVPGVEPATVDSLCYIVQEIKAPAGYVLPTAEEDRTWAVNVTKGASQTNDLDIANTKVSVPDLPLTGAAGRILLMAGGLALVLGSMGIAMVVRRRKENA